MDTYLKELKKEVEEINKKRSRSHWGRGVALYVHELLDNIEQSKEKADNWEVLRRQMLCGAASWLQYSEGGCSLIHDGDICERLATPSEQKRKRSGELQPNSRESWLEVQARALSQASNRIKRAFIKITNDDM